MIEAKGRKLIGEFSGTKFPADPSIFITNFDGTVTIYDFDGVGREQTVLAGVNYDGTEAWNIKDSSGAAFTGEEIHLIFNRS